MKGQFFIGERTVADHRLCITVTLSSESESILSLSESEYHNEYHVQLTAVYLRSSVKIGFHHLVNSRKHASLIFSYRLLTLHMRNVFSVGHVGHTTKCRNYPVLLKLWLCAQSPPSISSNS